MRVLIALLLATTLSGPVASRPAAAATTPKAGVAWGFNQFGQLGNGTNTRAATPVSTSGLTDAVALAGGAYHSLAVGGSGTVWGWGYNAHGQLGDGTTSNRNTPVQVAGMSGAIAAAAGGYHSFAVRSDGTLWAWGYNGRGSLGDGTTVSRTNPVPVSGLATVSSVAAGDFHSLALTADGTVWAWGYNAKGQLGDGTTVDRPAPAPVAGLAGVVAIAAGLDHSLAVKADGTVWAWGWNGSYQLGDGSGSNQPTPVQVTGLTGATGVAGARDHSLAVKGDGTVWGWGYNIEGQLGDGTTETFRPSPVQAAGLTGATAVAAGAGASHSLARTSGGAVYAWGSNVYHQVGDGTTTNRSAPVRLSGLAGSTAIAAGTVHSLALVDLSAPEVSIIRPSPGLYAFDEQIVQGTPIPATVGAVTVEAHVSSPLFPITAFVFEVGGVEVAPGDVTFDPARNVYSFVYHPALPGLHTITAAAANSAGAGTAAVQILAAPG